MKAKHQTGSVISVHEYRQLREKRHKYNAVKTVVNGVVCDSKKEGERLAQLQTLEAYGAIAALVAHPRYPLHVLGIKVGCYVADFQYIEGGKVIVEDVKSGPTKTALWKWKVKHLQAEYPHLEFRVYE